MTHEYIVEGVVRGSVRFPDHPEHVGGGGLVGAEDVFANRTTFTSVGQAMTWCRKVLDGQLSPRRVRAAGDMLTPRTPPAWSEATVYVTGRHGDDLGHWETDGQQWRVVDGGSLSRRGAVVRTDAEPQS